MNCVPDLLRRHNPNHGCHYLTHWLGKYPSATQGNQWVLEIQSSGTPLSMELRHCSSLQTENILNAGALLLRCRMTPLSLFPVAEEISIASFPKNFRKNFPPPPQRTSSLNQRWPAHRLGMKRMTGTKSLPV